MEPSTTEYLEAELAVLLRAARREASYLPLSTLARVIGETLPSIECVLLAELLITYEQKTTPAEERA